MSDTANSTITVGVAAIGAMATIAAAYLSYAKERQNERARIAQDLEIVHKLPDESRAKEILQSYIENRAVLLPLERQLRATALGLVGGAASLVLFLVAQRLTEVTKAPLESYWWWVLLVLILPISMYASFYRHIRKTLIKGYAAELGLPSELVEPIGDRLAKSSVTWRFWKRGNP